VGAADAPEAPSTCVHLLSQGRIAGDAFPSPASAYLVLERCEGNVGPRISLQDPLQIASEDSLSARMGHCFAALPALRLAEACLDSRPSTLQFPGLYQAFRVEP
jgi:hypothetical protein